MGAVALTMGKSASGGGAGQCRGSVACVAGAEGAGQEEGLRSEKTRSGQKAVQAAFYSVGRAARQRHYLSSRRIAVTSFTLVVTQPWSVLTIGQ